MARRNGHKKYEVQEEEPIGETPEHVRLQTMSCASACRVYNYWLAQKPKHLAFQLALLAYSNNEAYQLLKAANRCNGR